MRQGTRVATGPTASRRRRRRLLPLLAVAMVLVVVAVGSVWGLMRYTVGQLDRVEVFDDSRDRPVDRAEGDLNVLLVGSDGRGGLTDRQIEELNVGDVAGRRSDTMILAHIPAGRDKATMVSLPRDWYVTIPAHEGESGQRVPAGRNKLNAAYALGGPRLAVSTVERATDVRIDHYLEVSFPGFVDVVDALGGVDICLPRPVDDPDSGLDMAAGKHHVGGVRALQYARARHGLGDGSDLDRIERQQKFLGAMMQQATSTGTLLNPVKFSRFVGAATDAVRADPGLSTGDMRRIAGSLRDLDPQRVKFVTVPVADPAYETDNAGLAVRANRDATARLFDRLSHDQPLTGPAKPKQNPREPADRPGPTIPPDRIAVEVYNGTRIDGLAARGAADLRQAGFRIDGAPANARPPRNHETTTIQYGPARADSARTLQASIPGAQLRETPELGATVQVVLGSSYHGTRDVQTNTGPANSQIDPRTAARGPCS